MSLLTLSEARPTIQYHHEADPDDDLNARIKVLADNRDPSNGNASHLYRLFNAGLDSGALLFQHGPRNEPGSTPGITDAALLTVLIDRYEGFQSGKFSCPENAKTLEYLNLALGTIVDRAKARRAQGVLGKNAAHVSPPPGTDSQAIHISTPPGPSGPTWDIPMTDFVLLAAEPTEGLITDGCGRRIER